MNWTSLTRYCIASKPYSVAKVSILGKTFYEAWANETGKLPRLIAARLGSAEQAKELCERDANESQTLEN